MFPTTLLPTSARLSANHSCFISYSTKDQKFAERLHADLQAEGVRCWFAPHDIGDGRKIKEETDEALRVHERLLLVVSAASMASEWVKTEIAKARSERSKEQRRVLFPVALVDFESLRGWEWSDRDSGKDSAREIREYSSQTLIGGRITMRIRSHSSASYVI